MILFIVLVIEVLALVSLSLLVSTPEVPSRIIILAIVGLLNVIRLLITRVNLCGCHFSMHKISDFVLETFCLQHHEQIPGVRIQYHFKGILAQNALHLQKGNYHNTSLNSDSVIDERIYLVSYRYDERVYHIDMEI